MVNTGRSKGCLTCRSRKIKCDENRPTCHKCRNSNYVCAGYESNFPVVLERPRPSRKTTEAESSRSGMYVRRFINSDPTSFKIEEVNKAIEIKVPPGFGQTATQQKTSRDFLATNLFLQHWGMSRVWLNLSAAPSLLSEAALDALAHKFYGLVHRQDSIIALGHRSYGEALGHLGAILNNVESHSPLTTIVATVLLLFYEALTDTYSDNYFIHASGIARLVEAIGPATYKNSDDVFVLESTRAILIYASIKSKRRTFLERKEWLEVPLAANVASKSPMQQLHDLACPIPGILEDAASVNQELVYGDVSNPAFMLLLASRQRAHDQLDLLNEWHTVWTEAYPPSQYSLATTSDYPSDLFGPATCFDDFDQAYITITYYSMRYELCQLLCKWNGQERVPGTLLAGVLTNYDPVPPANALCRCVPFMLDSTMHGSTGALLIRGPLLRIFHVYENDDERLSWILRMLERCQTLGLGGGATYVRSHLTAEKAGMMFED